MAALDTGFAMGPQKRDAKGRFMKNPVQGVKAMIMNKDAGDQMAAFKAVATMLGIMNITLKTIEINTKPIKVIADNVREIKTLITKQIPTSAEEAKEKLEEHADDEEKEKKGGFKIPSGKSIFGMAGKGLGLAAIGLFLTGLVVEVVKGVRDFIMKKVGALNWDDFKEKFKAEFWSGGPAVLGGMAIGAGIGIVAGPIGMVVGAILGGAFGTIATMMTEEADQITWKQIWDKIPALTKFGVAAGGFMGGLIFKTPQGALAGMLLGLALSQIAGSMMKSNNKVLDQADAQDEVNKMAEKSGLYASIFPMFRKLSIAIADLMTSLFNNIIGAVNAVIPDWIMEPMAKIKPLSDKEKELMIRRSKLSGAFEDLKAKHLLAGTSGHEGQITEGMKLPTEEDLKKNYAMGTTQEFRDALANIRVDTYKKDADGKQRFAGRRLLQLGETVNLEAPDAIALQTYLERMKIDHQLALLRNPQATNALGEQPWHPKNFQYQPTPEEQLRPQTDGGGDMDTQQMMQEALMEQLAFEAWQKDMIAKGNVLGGLIPMFNQEDGTVSFVPPRTAYKLFQNGVVPMPGDLAATIGKITGDISPGDTPPNVMKLNKGTSEAIRQELLKRGILKQTSGVDIDAVGPNGKRVALANETALGLDAKNGQTVIVYSPVDAKTIATSSGGDGGGGGGLTNYTPLMAALTSGRNGLRLDSPLRA